MQHLFGSFRLKKQFSKEKCAKHKKAMPPTSKEEGHASETQWQLCDMCGGIVDESCIHREGGGEDYVPVSWLRGKYVLLYLSDPTGVNITAARPRASSMTTSQSLGVGNSSLSASAPSSISLAVTGTVRSSLTTATVTAPAPANGTQGNSSISGDGGGGATAASASKTSRRIRSLLLMFYRLLIRQLMLAASEDNGKNVIPISILEVRQPVVETGDPSFVNNVLKKRQAVSANPTALDAASTVKDVPSSYSQPECTKEDEEEKEGKESSTPLCMLPVDSVSLPHASTTSSSPFFGGWLSLESAGAYMQVIKTFGVTSWPSVILFDPDGRLLTTRALEHIERELISGGMDCSQPFPLRTGGGTNHVDCEIHFHSAFPWLIEKAEEKADETPEHSTQMLSFPSLLKRVISHARCVGELLNDDDPSHSLPKSTTEPDGHTQSNDFLDGATHVALYFGAGWDPSSVGFLPPLRRLYLTLNKSENGDVDDDDDDIDDHGKHSSWNMEGRGLSTYFLSGSMPVTTSGMPSYRMGGFSDPRASNSLMDSDPRGFSSKCSSTVTSLNSSRRRKVGDPDLLENSGDEQMKEKKSGVQVNREDTTLLSSLQLLLPLQQQQQGGEQHQKEQEQEHQSPVDIVVIYMSCDTDNRQLDSVLSEMPYSWYCVSSLFGPSHRELIEQCLEFFDVRVFPRLVVMEVNHEQDVLAESDCGTPSMVMKSPSNFTFHIVQFHGERPVQCGRRAIEFPWVEKKFAGVPQLPFERPIANKLVLLAGSCDAIKSVVTGGGGCLFVLCGTGNVPLDVHRSCTAVLHEVCLWWSRKMEMLLKRLEERLNPSLQEMRSSLPADSSCDPEQTSETHHCSCLRDTDVFTAPATSSTKAPSLMTSDEQVPYLPVYFVDSIAEEDGIHDDDDDDAVDDSHNRRSSEESYSDSTRMERRALLQEYVLSQVMEDTQQIPPVEGEPFLVCVQWPERRSFVLRRKFNYEVSLAPPPVISMRSSGSNNNTTSITTVTAAASTSISTTSHSNPTSLSANATSTDRRSELVGTSTEVGGALTALPGQSTEFPSCCNPNSTTLGAELSTLSGSPNPLCCVSHVKAFVAEHALRPCR